MKISKKIMIVLFMVGVGLSFNLSQGIVDSAYAGNQPPPNPKIDIDGVCGETLNSCKAGTFKEKNDDDKYFKWECKGIDNGKDDKDCKLKKEEEEEHKVTICHRDNSVNKPYVRETVDADAADGDTGNDNGKGDHSEHVGPVAINEVIAQALKDAKEKWGDIIPPHDNYAGLNWTTDGQAVWNNECKYPEIVCEETVSCDDSCRDEDTYIKGDCGQILCEANSESCNDPTPTPTVSPTPTPTSNDEVSYQVADVKCGSDTVSASVHVKHDNIDQSGIRVLFKYIDQERIAFTGNDGQASVGFPYIVDGHVDILPDGFPSRQGFTTKEKDCETTETPSEGQVLGASTGEVLGAYAETGVAEDILMSLVGFSGAALTATGAVLNARKNS